jgi:uncharacterized membrane protein YjgN (DUF898 family)
MTETAEPVAATPDPVIHTHLGWALLSAILCFLPVGLVAVYFSLRTHRALEDGDLDGAARASRRSVHWLVAALVIGVLLYLFLAIVFALLGAFSR